MNDIEYRILRAQAGKGPDPDYSDPAVLEIAAALVDAKLVRGDVVRAFEPIPPGVTLGELTHAGLEALDAEERAREERKVLARLATRGDRLLMAVLAALVVLLVQRWLLPERAPCARCQCGAGEKAEEEPRDEPSAPGAGAPALHVPSQVGARPGPLLEPGLQVGDLPAEDAGDVVGRELPLSDMDGEERGERGAALVE